MDLAGIATVAVVLALACVFVVRANAEQWMLGLVVSTPLVVGVYHLFKTAFTVLGLMSPG